MAKQKETTKKAPLTREEFEEKAKSMKVTLKCEGTEHLVVGQPRQFSSGSFGWYANSKVIVLVDGEPVPVQVGITVTVIGSKET